MLLVRQIVPLMRAEGNLQWDEFYPNTDVFMNDIVLRQLWVADFEGIIGGFAAITTEQPPEYAQVGLDITEKAIVVHRLAVDPEFRGFGIATALMEEAEALAFEDGVSILRVDTSVQNAATQTLNGSAVLGNVTLTVECWSETGFEPTAAHHYEFHDGRWRIHGDLDAHVASRFGGALAGALRDKVTGDDLHIDLAEVGFVDVACAQLLVHAARAEPESRRVVLHEPPRLLRRLLDVLQRPVSLVVVDGTRP